MSDIVEKLKDACVVDPNYGKSVTLTLDYDDYMEAADTITALRAEVERLTGERDRQYDQNAEQIIRIAALEDENERLKKEALFTAISVLPEKDAENERLKEWNREIALNAREFAAENERLRAALKAISEVKPSWCAESEEMYEQARAALEEKP